MDTIRAMRKRLTHVHIPRSITNNPLVVDPNYAARQLGSTQEKINGDEIYMYVLPKVLEDACQNIEMKDAKISMEMDKKAMLEEVDKYFSQFNGQPIHISEEELTSIVQKILIKNIKYKVDGVTDTTCNNHMKEMGSLITENRIVFNSTVNTRLLFRDDKYKMTHPVQACIDLSKELISDGILEEEIKFGLEKLTKWYKYILSRKGINPYNYLTYAAQVMNENLFTSFILSETLDNILANFTANMKMETKEEPEKIDLFSARLDGMTHLDYALALLMKHRWEIADYYDEDKKEKREFTLSGYDKQLLQQLYTDRKIVRDAFQSIREITEDSEKYIPSGLLGSYLQTTYDEELNVIDPSSITYENKKIHDSLDKAMEKYENSPFEIKRYILDRVDLYKSLIADHINSSNEAKGSNKLQNLIQSTYMKNKLIGSAAILTTLSIGAITTLALRSRSIGTLAILDSYNDSVMENASSSIGHQSDQRYRSNSH
ncbi:hypothetical protein NEIRO02_2209 [Nematocida sp. AWRm79]|nr:hypothetical protein NEIRO02_2209 [Nematocida sp. AWRm79]